MKLNYCLIVIILIFTNASAHVDDDPPCPGPACPLVGGYYDQQQDEVWVKRHHHNPAQAD
jgi:hypothetical protein